MKHFKYSVIACGVAMMAFTACNDEQNSDKLKAEVGIVSDVLNIPADASRITFYKSNQSSTTRATLTKDEAVLMPDYPMVPAGTKSVLDPSFKAWDPENGSHWIVEEGTEYTINMKMNHNTVYVFGSATLNNIYGAQGTIYVMEGGQLNVTYGTLDNNFEIINYGLVTFPASYTMNNQASLKSSTPLEFHQLNMGGELFAFSTLKASSLTLRGTGKMVGKECMIVDGDIQVTNSNTLEVYSYLKASNIQLNSSGELNIYGEAMIDCNTLDIANSSSYIINPTTKYAVIKCNQLIINHSNIKKTFQGYIDIHAVTINNKSGKELEWPAGTILNGTTHIPATDCRPEFGSRGEESGGNKEPIYGFEHIATLESPNNDERVSATSIALSENDAYVSWHVKGEEFGGYIDKFTIGKDISDNNFEATLFDQKADYNHIFVDGNDFYVAGGNNRSGAFYGKISYTGDATLSLEEYRLIGASGNCLLKDGENIWAVSGKNGAVLKRNLANKIRTDRELAQAKYIAKKGNQMIVLAGAGQEQESLAHFDTRLITFDQDLNIVDEQVIGQIYPYDGKNGLFVDGDDIYAALSQYGLVKVTGNSISRIYKEAGSASCVYVDESYIYLANDQQGLFVLDKNSNKVLAKYKPTLSASANFVTVDKNKNIYIAYGLRGVEIIRFNKLGE